MRITELQAGTLQSTDYIAIDDAAMGTRKLLVSATVDGLVSVKESQSFTETEKAQGRSNIGVVSASTTGEGLVQLYDGIDSTSTALAATAAAVKLAAESGAVPVSVTKTGVSSLPQTIENTGITATMVLIHSELSNPSAQTGDWTITTAAGTVTISGTISGTTDIKLILSETN